MSEHVREQEIIQIVPAEGWRQAYLTFDPEDVDDYLPSGLGVSFSAVAVWALLRGKETGEMFVSGLSTSYSSLKGQEYETMPERTVGFVGYIRSDEHLKKIDVGAQYIASEEGVVGKPWVRR